MGRGIKEWKLGKSDLETLEEQRERLAADRDRARADGDMAQGIAFKESLAGRSGMSFVLLPDAHHTMDDIEAAGAYLRANRDVVELSYARLDSDPAPGNEDGILVKQNAKLRNLSADTQSKPASRAFKPTLAMIAAAEALLLAQATEMVIRPVVEGYERKILEKGQWHISPDKIAEGGRDEIILDPKLSYLLSAADFFVYDQECHAERRASRLPVEREGDCPLLVAEHKVIAAKRALIDAMEGLTGISADSLLNVGLDAYREYVDLTLGQLSPFVDSQRIHATPYPANILKPKSPSMGM